MDLMTNRQMAHLDPTEQAQVALRHMISQIKNNPALKYHLGFGTQTFSNLTEAYASLSGEDLKALREKALGPIDRRRMEQDARFAARQAHDRYRDTLYVFGSTEEVPFFDDLPSEVQNAWIMATNPHLKEPLSFQPKDPERTIPEAAGQSAIAVEIARG